jgi:hypothetical protein
MNTENKLRSFSNTKFRKWSKVIDPIAKYNRTASDEGYPLYFYSMVENYVSAGKVLNVNIVTTLTGTKDNCIKTVFQNEEQIGKVTFLASIQKSSFDLEVDK